MKTSSWIIRNKETKEVIMETFDKRKVDALNTAKYEAVPILDYLAEVNAKAKAALLRHDATPHAEYITDMSDLTRLNYKYKLADEN